MNKEFEDLLNGKFDTEGSPVWKNIRQHWALRGKVTRLGGSGKGLVYELHSTNTEAESSLSDLRSLRPDTPVHVEFISEGEKYDPYDGSSNTQHGVDDTEQYPH